MPRKRNTETEADIDAAVAEDAASEPEAFGPPAPPPAKITFRSVREEPISFQVNGIDPERDGTTKFLVWKVGSEEEAVLFELHYHVQMGRVARVRS